MEKEMKISLIIVNIFIWSIITIVLFMFGMIYVNALSNTSASIQLVAKSDSQVRNCSLVNDPELEGLSCSVDNNYDNVLITYRVYERDVSVEKGKYAIHLSFNIATLLYPNHNNLFWETNVLASNSTWSRSRIQTTNITPIYNDQAIIGYTAKIVVEGELILTGNSNYLQLQILTKKDTNNINMNYWGLGLRNILIDGTLIATGTDEEQIKQNTAATNQSIINQTSVQQSWFSVLASKFDMEYNERNAWDATLSTQIATTNSLLNNIKNTLTGNVGANNPFNGSYTTESQNTQQNQFNTYKTNEGNLLQEANGTFNQQYTDQTNISFLWGLIDRFANVQIMRSVDNGGQFPIQEQWKPFLYMIIICLTLTIAKQALGRKNS